MMEIVGPQLPANLAGVRLSGGFERISRDQQGKILRLGFNPGYHAHPGAGQCYSERRLA